MAKFEKLILIVLFMSTAIVSRAADAVNLLEDPSFEDILPLWLVKQRPDCAVSRPVVENAPDGKRALEIKNWISPGCLIFSPPLTLKKGTTASDDLFSFSCFYRTSGNVKDSKLTIQVFGGKKGRSRKIIGEIPLSADTTGKWRKFVKQNVKLGEIAAFGRIRLNLCVKGTRGPDAAVYLDCLTLTRGTLPKKFKDTAATTFIPAREIADGNAWSLKKQRDFRNDFTVGLDLACGYKPLKDSDSNEFVKKMRAPVSGTYRVWVQYLVTDRRKGSGEFTLSLRQPDGSARSVGEGKDAGDAAGGRTDKLRVGGSLSVNAPGPGKPWRWSCFDAYLREGDFELVLSRPRKRCKLGQRRIGGLLFTGNLNYKPNVRDFTTPGYVRFIDENNFAEPYLISMPGRHFYSKAGLTRNYLKVPDESRISNGAVLPWVRMNGFLRYHKVPSVLRITALRAGGKPLQGPFKGVLEFAAGERKKVVKRIRIDQINGGVILYMSGSFPDAPDEIKTPWSFVDKKRAVIAKIPDAGKPRAKKLFIATSLYLSAERDDEKLLQAELNILKGLGFNALYSSICAPGKGADFLRANGMIPKWYQAYCVLWHSCKPDMWHPNRASMLKRLNQFKKIYAKDLDNILGLKIMDEPYGMSMKTILSSDACAEEFRNWLRGKGLTPAKLGAPDWKIVKPVGWSEKEKSPELFYHTAIFRLEAAHEAAKAYTQTKNQVLGEKVAPTWVNYVPTWSSSIFKKVGMDPFYAQRDNGFQAIGVEDWLGYGLGPQHFSDLLALMRSATKRSPQDILAYVVLRYVHNPVLVRLKIHTALAGGVKRLNIYCYGPKYAGIDDWSTEYGIYPELSKTLHGLANVEDAVLKAKRVPTGIAILYNRTANVWEKNSTMEQNGWYLRWALSHDGFDPDYICESDVMAGDLKNYSVLYLSGAQVREDVAAKIADWVKAGGVLAGDCLAGTRNEYNRPVQTLNKVFGVKSENGELKRSLWRPRYETRWQKPFWKCAGTPKSPFPGNELRQYFAVETIVPTTGTPLLKGTEGTVGGVRNSYGKGTAFRFSTLLGIDYILRAVARNYDLHSFLPKRFDTSMRKWISLPAVTAGERRLAVTSEPIVEFVRCDSTDESVLYVIDHDAADKPDFKFRLNDAGDFKSAYSASGADIKLRRGADDSVEVTMPLHISDIVVFRKK